MSEALRTEPDTARVSAEALGNVLARAENLVAAIQLDDSGQLVGNQWMGGGGGLLSRDTLKAADQLRNALDRFKGDAAALAAVEGGGP